MKKLFVISVILLFTVGCDSEPPPKERQDYVSVTELDEENIRDYDWLFEVLTRCAGLNLALYSHYTTDPYINEKQADFHSEKYQDYLVNMTIFKREHLEIEALSSNQIERISDEISSSADEYREIFYENYGFNEHPFTGNDISSDIETCQDIEKSLPGRTFSLIE